MNLKLPRASSKECEKALRKAGWVLDRQRGDHRHFVHPERKGVVTIPKRDTLVPFILKSILKQAGLTVAEFRELIQKR